jgi:DNA-binding cell septation regulator SpoVG
MFNSENKEQTDKRTYEVNVLNVRKTKNDAILMLDIDVNGVKIYSCIFKEVTVKKDGQKYKKGDKCYVLSLPSEKSGDKYYDRVWFPVSNETMDTIIEQIKEKL